MRQNRTFAPCKYLQRTLLGTVLLCVAAGGLAADASPRIADEFAIPEPAQSSSDSYDLVVLAAKSIQPGGEGTPDTEDKLTPEEDLKRQRAFTEKNARALEMMRDAMREPIVPPAGRDYSNFSLFSNREQLGKLSLLAMQHNRVLAADGQWDKAVEGALDIVQMGIGLQSTATMSSMFDGKAMQENGRADAWAWIAHLDAPTATQAAQRLENLDNHSHTAADAFREEKWHEFWLLRMIVTSPEWEKFQRGEATEWNDLMADTVDKDATALAQLRKIPASDIMRHYLETMDAVIAQAALPFQRDAPLIAAAGDPLSNSHTQFYSLNNTKLKKRKYGFQVSRRVDWEKTRAGNRLLMTAFSLQSFVKEYGHYPETLDELCPKYLQAVPLDPFGVGKPFVYKRKGETYALYSVGPDGADNGGTPLQVTDKDLKDGYTTGRLTSEGDLVAGQFK